MRAIDQTKPILVTGGSGYIAGWIIRYLLEAGLTVRATVRNTGRRDKVLHLTRLATSRPGTLRLFSADLLTPGDFDDAMQGCELVVHTASPFVLDKPKNARETFIQPALEGTRNVLEAANAVETVKRVVLTSSAAAVYGDVGDMAGIEDGMLTEAHWNTTSTESHQPYSYSKTVAEQAAWEMSRAQDRWDLVTVNPAMVLGPSLTRSTASGSVALLKQYGDGTLRFGVPELSFGVVDVRDAARAHIDAAFTPGASGRHLLSAGVVRLIDIGRILKAHFGDGFPFPTRIAPKFIIWLIAPLFGMTREYVKKNVGYTLRLDNSRSVDDLGVAYRPIEQTIVDHFQQLIDDGLVKRK